jgi:Meiotically up-regulated gene 113
MKVPVIDRKRRPEVDLSSYGEGFVYFIRMGEEGPIKIGRATNPNSRISSIASACPIPIIPILLIPGADLERKLHAYFFQCWIKGEWFESDPYLLRHIEVMLLDILDVRAILRRETPVVRPPVIGDVDMDRLVKFKSVRRHMNAPKVGADDKRKKTRLQKPRGKWKRGENAKSIHIF